MRVPGFGLYSGHDLVQLCRPLRLSRGWPWGLRCPRASEDARDNEVAGAVGIFFPNQGDRGTHINISGAGIVEDAPNRDNALAFIEFLAGPEAQKVFADQNNEYPVIGGLEPSPQTRSFGDFKTDAVNVSEYGDNNPEAVRIFDRVGWP